MEGDVLKNMNQRGETWMNGKKNVLCSRGKGKDRKRLGENVVQSKKRSVV